MNTMVIAEHAPDLPVSGRAFLTHAVLCFMAGKRQRSNEYFQRALDLPSLQSDSYELGRAYNRIGGVHFWLGEIPEAETALQEAHQRLLPAAEPVELGKNINLLCSIYYLQGRFREMEQLARGACEKYRSLEDELLIGMVVPVWALATGGKCPKRSSTLPGKSTDLFIPSMSKRQATSACGNDGGRKPRRTFYRLSTGVGPPSWTPLYAAAGWSPPIAKRWSRSPLETAPRDRAISSSLAGRSAK